MFARDRNVPMLTFQRIDTLLHMQFGNTPDAVRVCLMAPTV